MTSQDETLQRLHTHSASIPFNRWLGLEVLSALEDRVELRVPWRAEFMGAPGMTHGGILASIIDAAAFLVLLAARGSGGPTIDMRIDYHRSTANTTFYVRSSLLRAGATISTVEVGIYDGEQRLIASGRSVMISEPRRSPSQLQ
jgi:uncharacterized protein (TIGR00369 family)